MLNYTYKRELLTAVVRASRMSVIPSIISSRSHITTIRRSALNLRFDDLQGSDTVSPLYKMLILLSNNNNNKNSNTYQCYI